MNNPPLKFPVVSAQIRAGRALLDWSQENLATEARISLTSVREIESLKRPLETPAAIAVICALKNAGVIFVPGSATGGPGVRLAGSRPSLIRRPSVVTKWEGVPAEVEWQGKSFTVFVSREVLADLDMLKHDPSDVELLQSFERNSDRILDAVAYAMFDAKNFDQQGRLYIRGKDVFGISSDRGHGVLASQGYSMESFPAGTRHVKIRPLPLRYWHGARQEPADDIWVVEQVLPADGRIVISNTSTDHTVPIYRAHIRDVIPEFAAGGGGTQLATLHLSVQMVFEDGHIRLEPVRQAA